MCEPLGTNGFPTHIKTVSQQWLGKDFPQFIAPLPSFLHNRSWLAWTGRWIVEPNRLDLQPVYCWGYKCSLRLSTSQKHSHSRTHLPEKKNEHTQKKRRGGQVGKASCQPTSGLGGEEPKCARCTVPIQLTSAPFLSISAAPAVFVTDIPSFINHRKQLRDFVTSEQHTANSAHVQAWACKWQELKRSYRRKKKLYNFHFWY